MADKLVQEDELMNYSSDEENDKKRKNKRARPGKTTTTTKTAKTTPAEKGKPNTHHSTFKDFQLREELLRGLGEAGFENPSDVQSQGIPYIIYGEDLLCQAKSGMGKTAVFVLGVLHSIEIEGKPFQCLVLCHTRELAFQISKEFERLGKYIEGLKIATVFGGVNEEAQILQLENNPPHVLVGTPGRTYSLIKKKKVTLDKLKFFILDECDKILEQYGKYFFFLKILTIRYETNHTEHFCADESEKTSTDVHGYFK
jgi:ATP-dependent RNA helicase UAP56/SUB2